MSFMTSNTEHGDRGADPAAAEERLSASSRAGAPEWLVPAEHAILLDIDGTLLDIADEPDLVVVPPMLPRVLSSLWSRAGGALALVSGRSISDVDRIFMPLRLPTIGGHGVEWRYSSDGATEVQDNGAVPGWLRQLLQALVAQTPGLTIEDKTHSLAVHYRKVPSAEPLVSSAIAARHNDIIGAGFEIQQGKCVIEIKRHGFNKGTAVRNLLAHEPFKGRRPVFIGDDKTDEHVFQILSEFDGVGYSVGRKLGNLGYFESPNQVRRWLEMAAKHDGQFKG